MRYEYISNKNSVFVIVYTSTRDAKEVYGGQIAGLYSTRNNLFFSFWRKIVVGRALFAVNYSWIEI